MLRSNAQVPALEPVTPVGSRTARRLLMAVGCAVASVVLAPGATGEQAASHLRGFQAGMLDAGPDHSCAVLHDGSAACWGYEDVGQLGDGDATTTGSNIPSPVRLPGGRKAVAISAGLLHTCAILDDASAACWGDDSFGQLGDGATTGGSDIPSPVSFAAGQKAVAISAGSNHACAVLADGSAACWGNDGNGRLGDGATTTGSDVPSPVVFAAGQKAVAINAGTNHTCALLDDASATCWGSDDFGQLGDGATTTGSTVPSPVSLAAGQRVVSMSAGFGHTCAVLEDAGATCWGYDGSGQLGDGSSTLGSTVPSPVSLAGGKKAVTISAGNLHTCAAIDDGGVSCWGFDGNGELGDGGANASTDAPSTQTLPAGSMVTRVADISLRIEGAPPAVDRGVSTQVTLRIENRGPDPATGVKVGLFPSLVQIASANAGHGLFTGSTWDVGTLAVGQQGLLVLALSTPSAGAGSLRAEVIASEVVDPDSKPNNGASTEDDQAQTSITVAAPASPAPASPAPASPAAFSISRLSLSPRTFRAKGLKGSRKVGTRLRFTLSDAAKVTVTIERKAGRRFKKAGSFSFAAKAGDVRRTFTGVLGGKPLAVGNYRLRIRALSGASTSTLGPLAFRIVTG